MFVMHMFPEHPGEKPASEQLSFLTKDAVSCNYIATMSLTHVEKRSISKGKFRIKWIFIKKL